MFLDCEAQRLHVRFVQERSACKIFPLPLPRNIRNEIPTDVRTATLIKSRCNGLLKNFGPIARNYVAELCREREEHRVALIVGRDV